MQPVTSKAKCPFCGGNMWILWSLEIVYAMNAYGASIEVECTIVPVEEPETWDPIVDSAVDLDGRVIMDVDECANCGATTSY